MTAVRRPDGVYLIAIYYGLLALLFLLGSCLVLAALATVISVVEDPIGQLWSAIALGMGLVLCLVFFFGSVIAVWGLLAFRHWGRWAAVVLAVLQLLGFPIFTIIGGLILYYLLRPDVVNAFS
ncbi:MAG: hypothetical protein ACP5TV_07435 [Anaerolineae bacterium]